MEFREGQAKSHLKMQFQKKAGFLFLTREIDLSVEPLEIFKKIASVEKAAPHFFFQNTEGDNLPAHTYLGFDAFEKMTVVDGCTRVERQNSQMLLEGNPFKVIGQRLQGFRGKRLFGLPFFFQGGMMGYFGYDSVRYLEPSLEKIEGAFAALKLDKKFVDGTFVIFQKLIIFNHLEKKIFLLSGSPFEACAQMSFNEVFEKLDQGFEVLSGFFEGAGQKKDSRKKKSPGREELPLSAFKLSLGKKKFIVGVKKLKENILAGDIFQAVLSEKFQIKLKNSALEIFENLVREKSSAYQFYFSNENKVVLGASPEMLLRVKDGEVETHPIAGTRRRGKNSLEDKKLEDQLRSSTKERAEHLMLVDLARNDIGRISESGSVRVPEFMVVKKFPGVFHLVSRVTGLLKKGKTPIDALGACFPAGTLSGAPKIRAMQLISELEKVPRGFYGGAVTLASFTGDLDSCIAIRSLEVRGDQGFLQAGAGIVTDSRPEKEYDEIVTKSRMLRQVLAQAQIKKMKGRVT